MEKLPICRICFVKNVSMYVVVNRNLHELYEKLTDIPFVTMDSRPMLACFFCCAKLKQCYRLLRKCLEAEELFAQMMNEDYVPNPLINQDHLEFCGGFIKSPIMHISIVDKCQTESIAIKEELPAVCEGLDDIIEPKEEHQSDELERENLDNSCLDVADVPPHYSESDLEDDVPLMEFKTEVEEEQVELEPENFDNSFLDVADIPLQQSESDLEDDVPLMEFKTEVEEQAVSKNKRRVRETTRATVAKKPKLNSRRTKLEDAIPAEQMKKEKSDSKVIRTTQKRTFCEMGDLTKHIRIHTGEKPYECDVCQRSFSLKSSLLSHIRIHTGEKPFKCDVCERSFRQLCQLKRHIRIHTGEKPYKCDVCQRSFGDKGALTKHNRVHTGAKPFKCDVCQCSFRRNGHLANHIRKHTGEKPFKCDICQCSFRQTGHLAKHIRTHTAEKPFKRM